MALNGYNIGWQIGNTALSRGTPPRETPLVFVGLTFSCYGRQRFFSGVWEESLEG